MSDDWRNELITKGAALDALTEVESHYEFEDGHDHLMGWAKTKIFVLPPEQPFEDASDCISRQAAIDALCEKPLVWDEWTDEYSLGQRNQYDDDKSAIEALPSAQPYTEEELRVFQHGISLILLSKQSSQHWKYDEDTATEIKFLERLYEKVGADIRGKQNEKTEHI